MVEAAQGDVNRFAEFAFHDARRDPIRQARFHIELQAFLSEHRHALVELPRDHGKSQQICMRLLWELGAEPGLRIKLVCATEAMAAERSRFLREQIESNLRLRLVFPKLKPGNWWSAKAFSIDRPANTIGPSVAAFGVGSGSTGARADLLVCDDLVDVKSLHSKTDRERTTAYFQNNLMNLLEPDGRFWNLSTPWHPNDVNSWLKSTGVYPLYRRAVGPDDEPVWQQKWPVEALRRRKAEIGEAGYARNYRLVCVNEEECLVRREWIRFHTETSPTFDRTVLAIDPAVSVHSKADASALVLAGRTGNTVLVVQAMGRRVSAPQLMEWIDQWNKLHKPDVILMESNAAFAGLRDVMQKHAAFGHKLIGRPSTKHKADRIAALSIPVQAGLVLFGRNQTELIDELVTFPNAAHDDLADACAAAVEWLLNTREPRAWV